MYVCNAMDCRLTVLIKWIEEYVRCMCVHTVQCADDLKMDKYFNYILQPEALLTISKWIEVDLYYLGSMSCTLFFWILDEWGDSDNVIVIYILVVTTGC